MAEKETPANALRRLRRKLEDLRDHRAERHRPTGLGFAFADRIDYLDPQRWDAVTAHAGFFLRRPVLRAIEALRRFSYRPLETEPNMVLTLAPGWRTHDDYLGALDSKYRKEVKDQAKKLAAAGCTLESLDAAGVATYAERLHQLYLAVQGNAAVRLVTLRPGYFAELARLAPDDFRCTVIRRGAEIVGFVTTVRDNTTAIGYYVGFDRVAAAEGLPIYLQLLHATIRDALAWRCERLSLGRTALEPKAGLGAKPEPMAVWMRHRVPALNWLLRGLLETVPHAEPPERNPFKTTAGSDSESS